MAENLNAANILKNIGKGSKSLISVRADIKRYFRLCLKNDTSTNFALKCLAALATFRLTLDKDRAFQESYSALIDIVRACCQHILDSSITLTFHEHNQLCRSLYSIISAVSDVSYSDALEFSNALIHNIKKCEELILGDKDKHSTFVTGISPIVRNSFVIFWNAAIKVECVPSEALNCRHAALTFLSFSVADFAKFSDKAVTTAVVYCSKMLASTTEDQSCSAFLQFNMSILGLFEKRLIKKLDISRDEEQSLFSSILKFLHVSAVGHSKCLNFHLASSVLDRAKDMVNALAVPVLMFGVNVIELSITFSRFIANSGHGIDANLLLPFSNIISNKSECMKAFRTAKDKMDLTCFKLCLNFLRQHLHEFFKKAAEDASVVSQLEITLPQFTSFVVTLTRVASKRNLEDGVHLLTDLFWWHLHHLKMVVQSCKDVSADAHAALDVLQEHHMQISKTNKFAELVQGVMNPIYCVIVNFYTGKLYADCIPFVRRYFKYIFATSNAKDNEFSAKLRLLIYCYIKAGQEALAEEALNVLAQCMALNIGQTTMEAMKLWVYVKKQAHRQKFIKPLTITTRELVAPHISITLSRSGFLKHLLVEELKMLKTCPSLYDEICQVVSELYDFTDDPAERSFVYVQMARLMVNYGTDSIKDMTVMQCCQEAITILSSSDKTGILIFCRSSQWILVEAEFLMYISGQMERCRLLNEKVNQLNQNLEQLKIKKRLEAEKNNIGTSEKNADEDVEIDDAGITSCQTSTIHEEFLYVVQLDHCLGKWKSLVQTDLSADSFTRDIVNDLRIAGEIYANARIYGSEIAVWELFLNLTSKQEMWDEYIDGASRLCTTLVRLGISTRAKQLLEDAAGRVPSTSCGDSIITTTLVLVRSELFLMENRIQDGWKCLCDAMREIKEMRNSRCVAPVLLLECQALSLKSRYCELPEVILLEEDDDNDYRTIYPVACATEALRCCLGLLKSNAQNCTTISFHQKQRILGCLLEVSHRLGHLYLDIGSPREARCYLQEKLQWTRRWFFVNQTIEVLLSLCRVDLLCGNSQNCRAKLHEVHYVMDSTDEIMYDTGRSPLLSGASHAEKEQETSPIFSNNGQSLFTWSSCSKNCVCVKCQQPVIHRLRAECMFVMHELEGKPSATSTHSVLKHAKILSEAETSVLSKFTGVTCDVQLSVVHISMCRVLCRLAGSYLEAGESTKAFKLAKLAMTKVSQMKSYHGIGEIRFLTSILKYQLCLSMLVDQMNAEGTSSSSFTKLVSVLWSGVDIKNSSSHLIDQITERLNRLDVNNKGIESARSPKNTRSHAARKLPLDNCIRTQTSSEVGCLTINKTQTGYSRCVATEKEIKTLSVFKQNFSSDEDDQSDLSKLSSVNLTSTKYKSRKNAFTASVTLDYTNDNAKSLRLLTDISSDKENSDSPSRGEQLFSRDIKPLKNVLSCGESRLNLISVTRSKEINRFCDDLNKNKCLGTARDNLFNDEPVTYSKVVKLLDDVLNAIRILPPVPLYGDLNLLLALLKGNCNHESVQHLLESVGISFRHHLVARLSSQLFSCSDGDSEMPSTVQCQHDMVSFHRGSLLSKNQAQLNSVLNSLPDGMVVCQINALPNVISGVSNNNPELVVTRLERNHRPILVKIACPESTVGARNFLKEFNDIMTEMSLKIRVTSGTKWWSIRKSLDNRLKNLLNSMEDDWLGHMKCLFLGRSDDAKYQLNLLKIVRATVLRLRSHGVKNINKDLLELVIDSWSHMKCEHHNAALAMVCGISSSDDRLDKMCKDFQGIVNAKLCKNDATRQAVVLILDKIIHALPWENIPILRENPATRMPSFHVLIRHLSLHRVSKESRTTIDASKAFYVLNPSMDLVRTQETFESFFYSLNWSGIVGKPPTKDEWATALNTMDLFVYCGHGAGSRYASGDFIEKRFCKAVLILMGCSSAILQNQGPNLEPHGIVLKYLASGCPCYIGNMWDVTDKDIDRWLMALLKDWLANREKHSCILQHLLSARQSPILTYLIGAAPVVYGLPAYMLQN